MKQIMERRYAGDCSEGYPFFVYPKFRRYDGLCSSGYPIWVETHECDPEGEPYYEGDYYP